MLVLIASVALAANHVQTFVIDPSYTKPPFAGMEQLFVDPAATQAQLKPMAERPAGEKVVDAPGAGKLVFTNPMSQWAEVTVNGIKVGIIGPYATCTFDGMGAGWYALEAKVSTGFARTFAVEVK